MTKKHKWGLVIGILTIVCLAIIWGSSLTPGNESGAMSGSLTDCINRLFKRMSLPWRLLHNTVRKAAHFAEFALLGSLACANLYIWLGDRNRAFVLLGLPCCAVIALADEFIQRFVEGRGPAFGDVLIDVSGSALAVLIFFGVVILRDFLKKRSLDRA